MNNYTTVSQDTASTEPACLLPHISTQHFTKVIAIEYYAGDIILVKRSNTSLLFEPEPPDRKGSQLMYLSAKARRRMFFAIATSGIDWQSLLTLSFPKVYPTDGQATKSILNAWLAWYRRTLPDDHYFWFLEFQRRGAPHFHVVSTHKPYKALRERFANHWASLLKDRLNLNQEDYERTYRVHVHPRQWAGLRSRDGALRYVAKYAHKTKQKSVPEEYQNVGRFWGACRHVKPVKLGDAKVSEDVLRTILTVLDHPVREYDFIPKHLYGIPYEDLSNSSP